MMRIGTFSVEHLLNHLLSWLLSLVIQSLLVYAHTVHVPNAP